MHQKKIKIAITGAAGRIGYPLTFRIPPLFSFDKDIKVELSILDLPQKAHELEGMKMELLDCAYPNLINITTTTSIKTLMENADLVLFVGSFPRTKGMIRADLLERNVKIFIEQGEIFNKYANPNAVALVVGNPVNNNCITLSHFAANKKIYGLSMLDHNRCYNTICSAIGCHKNEISELAVYGCHSNTQYPDFYNTKVNNRPLKKMVLDDQWYFDSIKKIQSRGAKIIDTASRSSAGSAVKAILDTILHLCGQHSQNFFSLITRSTGIYGFSKGLYASLPCRVVEDGNRIIKNIQIIGGIQHDVNANRYLEKTAAELENGKNEVRNLLNSFKTPT